MEKLKNKGVCKGCKYLMARKELGMTSACGYLLKTGKSRIVQEMANGGIQTKSCICYEAETRRKRRKKVECE